MPPRLPRNRSELIGIILMPIVILSVVLGVIYYSSLPSVYVGKKVTPVVDVICEGYFTYRRIMIEETDTTFTVSYGFTKQFPKKLCSYTVILNSATPEYK